MSNEQQKPSVSKIPLTPVAGVNINTIGNENYVPREDQPKEKPRGGRSEEEKK